MTGFCAFSGWIVIYCVHAPLCLSPVNSHLIWFHILAVVSHTEINMGFPMSVYHVNFISLGYPPSSEITSTCFSISSNLYSIIHNGLQWFIFPPTGYQSCPFFTYAAVFQSVANNSGITEKATVWSRGSHCLQYSRHTMMLSAPSALPYKTTCCTFPFPKSSMCIHALCGPVF